MRPGGSGRAILYASLLVATCVPLLVACGSADPLVADAAPYHELALWLDAHALPSETVAAPARWDDAFPQRAVVPLPAGTDAFALLAALDATRPDYVVAQESVVWDGARARPWFQARYHAVHRAEGLTLFRHAPSPFDAGEVMAVGVAFGADAVTLRAYRVPRFRLTPGAPLVLSLYWADDLPPVPDADRLTLRLLDDHDAVWSRLERPMAGGLPPGLQREPAGLVSHHRLAVPSELPAGEYRLELALYRRSGQAMAVRGAPGPRLVLARFYRPVAIGAAPPRPDHPLDWTLGDAIALVGYDAPTRVAPGDEVRVALYWHARDPVPGDYKVFVHLLDAEGQILVQSDGKPRDWTYPTTAWAPGTYVRDVHRLPLPADMPRGDYALVVGMYDPRTGVRLPASGPEGAEGDVVPLHRLRVR